MEHKTVYLFFGPPGVGKGTIAQKCVKSYEWKHVSTGNLCRRHVKEATVFGKIIAERIDNGFLVPDEIIASLISDELRIFQDIKVPIILDGFPRTYDQAVLLHSALTSGSLSAYRPILIVFQASDDVIFERLNKRVVCSNPTCEKIYAQDTAPDLCDSCQSHITHRSDDAQGMIKKRLETYKKNYNDLMSFWNSHEYSYHMVSTEQPASDVFRYFHTLVLSEEQ